MRNNHHIPLKNQQTMNHPANPHAPLARLPRDKSVSRP
jgi:hypothetical protein